MSAGTTSNAISEALAAVPPGAWAVGVSGGADSVCLLLGLAARKDLRLHVAHLDHQTRQGASGEDAAFVNELCRRLGVPCTVRRRCDLESSLAVRVSNRSAFFRAMRLQLFRDICQDRGLEGVVLAHHRMDQIETIFQRLLRGSGPGGLRGMRPSSSMGGLRVLRPLLEIEPEILRAALGAVGQEWREDQSNASPQYQRNRVRRLLNSSPSLAASLLEMARSMGAISQWLEAAAPRLEEVFAARELAGFCPALAEQSARRWLLERGAPAGEVRPAVAQRLVEMAQDAASPARRHFPGGLLVQRQGGKIRAAPGAAD